MEGWISYFGLGVPKKNGNTAEWRLVDAVTGVTFRSRHCRIYFGCVEHPPPFPRLKAHWDFAVRLRKPRL